MRKPYLILSAATLSIFLWACSVPPPPGPAGCELPPPATPGSTETLSIRVDGLDRQYRLHLPAGYEAGAPTPLVLAFHGYLSGTETIEERSQLSAHADARGYIVVYPQSTSFEGGGLTVTSWNDLSCNASPGPEGPTCTRQGDSTLCPPECGDCDACNWCSCHDDIAFVAALLDDLQARLCVDPARVYATGFSNGGMFVHRLGCDLPERFAAIAPVSGGPLKGFACAPSTALPYLGFHGLQDDVAPIDGSASRFGTLFAPLDEVIDRWAGPSSQGCETETVPYPTPHDGTARLQCLARPACESGAEVVSCSWEGGHDWPETSGTSFGTDVVWEFFSRHRRASEPR